MKAFVFLFALFTTISDFFASARKLKRSHYIATFTFAFTTQVKVPLFHIVWSLNNDKLLLFKLEITKFHFLIINFLTQKLNVVSVRVYVFSLLFNMFMNLFNWSILYFPESHFFRKRKTLFGSYQLQ